jgi:Rieske Fe-S protein
MTPTPSAPPADDSVPRGSTDPARPVTRRSVVAGAGGVACLGLLVACGGGSTATAPGTAAPAPPVAASSEPPSADADTSDDDTSDDSDELASTDDVPVGGGTVFADQDVVVTQPTAGEFKAFSATCTHQGCKVNKVENGVIACPCHGSKFAIADGSVRSGPAKKPLPAKSVTVEGDSIVLA